MHAAPGVSHVAPVLAVPSPACRILRIAGFLNLHRISGAHSAEPESAVLHAKRFEDLPALELAQGHSRDPFHDLRRQQDSHTLVAKPSARREQERSRVRALDELAERGVRAAQFRVLGQHIRQCRRMRQQVEHTRLASFAPLEFGQIGGYGLAQRDLAALDQHHHCGRRNGLGDGGDEKHRIGFHRGRAWLL